MPNKSQTLVWAVVWAWVATTVSTGCPKICECKWRDGREMVVCQKANFIDVPRGLESSTQVLDLRHNNLRILPRDSFAYSGLLNLQKLWLNFCNIIYNKISKIEERALRVLGNLEILNVAGNRITFLNFTELRPLQVLRVIGIDDNPWYCDCRLQQLSHWMRERKLTASTPPSCSHPSWLYGGDWQALDDKHFLCGPHTMAVAPRILATDRDNVTLMCRVESEVKVIITWLVDETPIHNTNKIHRYKVKQSGDPDRQLYVSNFTILGVVREDQGIYRCLAENRAGTIVTDIMLQVSHEVAEVRSENVEQLFTRRGLLGAVSIVLFLVFFTCSVMYYRAKDLSLQISEDDILGTTKLTKNLHEKLG
ncbi:leucine-rich repeat-containing protein 4B-like [Penaeus monodon]|uniref:leucine-rich repeat-containing protein 4B-like n=1 Tax=Penaeus monodon TaxID=6687 RepID=UPI0018A7DB9F|nr:leucine-rich repeat-containing protein 4B-like [Penaeus monodon]